MDEKRFLVELLALLDKMKKQPCVYLGCASITMLRSFLDGFTYASNVFSDDHHPCRNLPGFQDWIQKYYGIDKTPLGWNSLILQANSNDEEKALFDFFELYDKFIKETQK